MARLAGVVVSNVENDLEPGIVNAANHVTQLDVGGTVCVTLHWREKRNAVVAPEVAQAHFREVMFVDKCVDGHQLDGCHAKRLDVLDDLEVAKPREFAAIYLIDSGVLHCVTAHVALVEDRFAPGDARLLMFCRCTVPCNDTQRHTAGAVLIVRIEHRIGPEELTLQAPRIRIDKQFIRVTSQAALRVVRPVHAVAIPLSLKTAGQIPMPYAVAAIRQVVTCDLHAGFIEKAQLYPFRDGGVHREIRPILIR
jgi:hypothetical protein